MKLSPAEHSEFMKEEMKEPEHKKLASMVKSGGKGKDKGKKESMIKRESKRMDSGKKSGFLKKNAGFKMGKRSTGSKE